MKSIRIMIIYLLFLFGIYYVYSYNTFDSNGIYYDNVRYSDNVDFYGVDGLNLAYSGNLNDVGDYYELYFDVINDSMYDVVISDYVSHDDDPYIRYELTYEDGKAVCDGDILKKGELTTLHYRVLYENPIVDKAYESDSSFVINYQQMV